METSFFSCHFPSSFVQHQPPLTHFCLFCQLEMTARTQRDANDVGLKKGEGRKKMQKWILLFFFFSRGKKKNCVRTRTCV